MTRATCWSLECPRFCFIPDDDIWWWDIEAANAMENNMKKTMKVWGFKDRHLNDHSFFFRHRRIAGRHWKTKTLIGIPGFPYFFPIGFVYSWPSPHDLGHICSSEELVMWCFWCRGTSKRCCKMLQRSLHVLPSGVIKHGVLEKTSFTGDFCPLKPPLNSGIFQPAMFDDTRGHLKIFHLWWLQPILGHTHNMSTSLNPNPMISCAPCRSFFFREPKCCKKNGNQSMVFEKGGSWNVGYFKIIPIIPNLHLSAMCLMVLHHSFGIHWFIVSVP